MQRTERIEFVRDRLPHRKGDVVDYAHPGAADLLVRRGIARRVAPAAAVPPVIPPAPAAGGAKS